MRLVQTVFALLVVFPCLNVLAVNKVELSCRQTKSFDIPDFAPTLSKVKGKDFKLTLTRNGANITGDEVTSMPGKYVGNYLPTDTYHFLALGTNVNLVLGSAGPYVGAKRVKIYFVATKGTPKDKDFKKVSMVATCTNENPGSVVSFIKLCSDAPAFTDKITCTSKKGEETAGMPEVFSFEGEKSSSSLNVTYSEKNDDPKTSKPLVTEYEGTLKFIPTHKRARNSAIKLLEYCEYEESGNGTSEIGTLRVSRDLVDRGAGLLSIPVSYEDGAATILTTVSR